MGQQRFHAYRPKRGHLTYLQQGFRRREAEVLAWLIEGKTNPENARLLQIEQAPVKFHLRSIYNWLGTDSRLAATLFALDQAHQYASDACNTHRVRAGPK
jgi:DNA-binding CsgD family transcriptional regulator